MSRTQEIVAIASLFITIIACIGGWIAVPQMQRLIASIRPDEQPSLFATNTVVPTQKPEFSEPTATSVQSMPVVRTATAVPVTTQVAATSVPTNTPLAYFFQEEFSAGLDESKWETVGPAPIIGNGAVLLESNLTTFPFIYTRRNPFPTQGKFVFETSLRYSNPAYRGVGLALATGIPPLGSEGDDSNQNIITIWGFHARWFIRLKQNEMYSGPPDLLQHAIEIRYDGKYRTMVDGKLVYTSEAQTDRPSALWVGAPGRAGQGWTTLQIDYIRIRVIE